MASRRYLNFDLLLEQEGDGQYQARVTDSPLGETPSVRFRLPFDATTLENLLLKLDPGRSGTRRVGANPAQQAAMDFGGPLYQAIFGGDLAVAWSRAMDRARSEQAGGLRLRLRLNDAGAIAGLPWELLYDARSNSFLAQSERTPLVRFLDVPQVARPMSVDGPLRVLAIISSPTDLDELDVEGEWARLLEALAPRVASGLVVLDRLPSATLSELGLWLRRNQTHVVHFVGHGDFDETLREGVIYFQDARGQRSAVTSSTLGPYLRDHDPLRMVVLNACRSARTDAVDPFGGMAQGLVQQDASAVVAMQFPISDRAALKFTSEFYGALVDGLPVDQAVSSARKSLLDGFRDEWATPVLFMRSPDGNIFEDVHAVGGAVPVAPVPDPVLPSRPSPDPEAVAHAIDRIREGTSTWQGTDRRKQYVLMAAGLVALVLVVALLVWLLPSGGEDDSQATDDVTDPTSPATPTTEPTLNAEGLPSGTRFTFDQLLVSAGNDPEHVNVYRVDLASGTATQVSFGDALEQGASMGPNRDAFAFVQGSSQRGRRIQVAAAPDGAGVRPLFADAPAKCLGRMERPAWPRGGAERAVVVCRETGDGDPHLLLLGFDGVERLEYDTPPGSNFGDPAISPDGQTLMYWENGDRREDGGFLWQVPVDKSAPPRQITFDEAPGDGNDRPNQDSDPVFSPNGDFIAFRRTAPDGDRDVWVANIDGKNPHPVVTLEFDDQDPTFSPQSDRIAFKHNEDLVGTHTRIYIVPVGGGTPTPMLPDPIDAIEHMPAWSRR